MVAFKIIKAQKLFLLLFCLVLFCAAFFRLYKLTQAPAGYFFDEIVVGVNSYNLANFSADEFGNRLPDFIKIADDFRHPAIFYATAPFIKIFGFNILAIRLATAIFGILTVAAVYCLAYLITKNRQIAALSMAMAAISPWLVNLSRSSNEVVLALFFLIIASIFFLLSQSGKKLYFVLLYLSLLLAWYSYSAAILLTFLHAAFFTAYAFLVRSPKQVKILTFSVFLALVIFPNAFYLLTQPKKITGRFDSISIFATKDPQLVLEEQLRDDSQQKYPAVLGRAYHNKIANYFEAISINYSAHFSGLSLLGANGGPARYRIPNSGLIYHLDIPFLLIGLYFIFKKLDAKKSLIVFWLVSGAIPASLTVEDIPNIQRAIFTNPAWQIITAFGIYHFFRLTAANNFLAKWRWVLAAVIFLGYVYFSSHFLHQLIYHQPTHQNWHRDSHWPRAVEITQANAANYNQLNLYSTIGHYFLFFYSPTYRSGYLNSYELQQQYLKNRNLWADWFLEKYYFRHKSCFSEQEIKQNVLYSVGQNCPLPKWVRILGEAKTSDGVVMITFFDAPYSEQKIQSLIKEDEISGKLIVQ